jgi:hypothetical protein
VLTKQLFTTFYIVVYTFVNQFRTNTYQALSITTAASIAMDANAPIYHRDFPALPGLTSGIDAYSAPAVNQGAVLNEFNVINAEKECRIREALLTCGEATYEEVRDAKRRKKSLQNTHNNEAVAPEWALQIMGNIQQEIAATRVQLQQELAATRADIQHIRHSLAYNNARSCNLYSVKNLNSRIEVVPNMMTGVVPPVHVQYPLTLLALENATSRQTNRLLQFYGLQLQNNETHAEKRNRLKQYLGILL